MSENEINGLEIEGKTLNELLNELIDINSGKKKDHCFDLGKDHDFVCMECGESIKGILRGDKK